MEIWARQKVLLSSRSAGNKKGGKGKDIERPP